MQQICASAPNKIIITGEHGVVYGSWAIAAPIEVDGKRNRVCLTEKEGEAKVVFKGDVGEAEINARGEVSGNEVYHPILAGVHQVLKRFGKTVEDLNVTLEMELEYASAPKGTGNSASIPACVALCLAEYLGQKLSNEELFEETFFVDNIYHGGKSSGMDPKAVTSEMPQKLRKVFLEGGATKFEYENARLELPAKTVLVLVDSYRSGSKNTTAEMIEVFARSHGISKKLFEMNAEERGRIINPFNQIVQKIEAQLHENGNAGLLGALFDENQFLLENVSCADIDEAIAVGKKNGALGGKITGAGGVGGALLLLCWKDDIEKIFQALKEKGFANWKVEFAREGPKVE